MERIEHTLSHVPGVEGVDSVRVRWIGHSLHAEVEIVSDADLSLAEAHEIAETARHELLHTEPRLRQAIIHTSPRDDSGQDLAPLPDKSCNHGCRSRPLPRECVTTVT